MIAKGNLPSQQVAIGAGFTPALSPGERRERKGYVLHLSRWTRAMGLAWLNAIRPPAIQISSEAP